MFLLMRFQLVMHVVHILVFIPLMVLLEHLSMEVIGLMKKFQVIAQSQELKSVTQIEVSVPSEQGTLLA